MTFTLRLNLAVQWPSCRHWVLYWSCELFIDCGLCFAAMFATPTPAYHPRPAIGHVVVTWLLSPRISPASPAEWRHNRIFPINKNQLFEGLNILMWKRLLGITSYTVENPILNVYTLKPELRWISARYTYELHTWALYLNPILDDRTNENFHVSMSYSKLHTWQSQLNTYPVSEFNEKHCILWMNLNYYIELLYWIIEQLYWNTVLNIQNWNIRICVSKNHHILTLWHWSTYFGLQFWILWYHFFNFQTWESE